MNYNNIKVGDQVAIKSRPSGLYKMVTVEKVMKNRFIAGGITFTMSGVKFGESSNLYNRTEIAYNWAKHRPYTKDEIDQLNNERIEENKRRDIVRFLTNLTSSQLNNFSTDQLEQAAALLGMN